MATKPLMDTAKATAAPKRKVPSFKRPNIASLVPPGVKDTVDRVVAAGMKLMYSPEMKDEREQAVQSDEPVPKKLAESVAGLLLVLDQQASGGGAVPGQPAAAAPPGGEQPVPPEAAGQMPPAAPGQPAAPPGPTGAMPGQPPEAAGPAQGGGAGGIPPEALFPAGMELLSEASAVLAAAGQDVTQDDYNHAALMLFALLGQKLGGSPEQIMQAAQQVVPQGGDEEEGEPADDEAVEGEMP